MIQSLEEYRELAVRTMKDDPWQMQVLHCTMGMAGEAGELAELGFGFHDHTIGELGDCMWYMANLFHLVNAEIIPFDKLPCNGDSGGLTVKLMITAATLTDYVKKGVFYGKVMDKEHLEDLAVKYLEYLTKLCWVYKLDILAVAESNIKKLEKRYPDLRFNAAHAQNRDYAAESKAAGATIA